ncbi:NUDIX domain-containing protein [Tateyamaria sp. SN6-1]|uniref:NUDIX domain-containing protein n=1 Tax=Tateyamaria sp. SN6-1 TaxID=3092148 RepID=UPI0039F5811D
MSTLFFYGTLRHAPLLAIVLGRPVDTLQIAQDTLPNMRTDAVAEGPFPMLVDHPGAQAAGLVVTDLSDTDRARLDYYEGGFDYDTERRVTAAGAAVEVYRTASAAWTSAGPWDFDAWRVRWALMTEHAAREVMSGFGHVSPEEIARRFPRIRARAWSKVLAANPRHGAGTLQGKVDVMHRAQAYSDFFAIEELKVRHERFDGSMSDPLERAVFVATDAAFLLPYDPVRDRVLLVEQIRMGPIGRCDPVLWQKEPIAGFVDAGEQPIDAARREAEEEAGLTLDAIEEVAACYPSPGATTEFYHLFVGLCDLPDDTAGIGGLPEEGENIRAQLMSFDALLHMAETRQAGNVPLALLTYWLAHHRARLRMG